MKLWNDIKDLLFEAVEMTEVFDPNIELSRLNLHYATTGSIYLRNLVHFDYKMLMGRSDDHEIVAAASPLIPYLKSEKVTMMLPLETLSMEELVHKIFKIVSSSVTLERKFDWFREFDGDGIQCENLGLGNVKTTWFGSPDARLTGSQWSDVAVLCQNTEYSYDSDDTSVLVKLKRKNFAHAIGTAVLSSFVEKNLHQSLNSMIPCLLLDSTTVRVILYDCEKDILLKTKKVEFRVDTQVLPSALLLMWIFINHRYVCIS